MKSIIKLGYSLGLNIVAEGVETIEQLEFLKDRPYNPTQGYYFRKPLESEKNPPSKLELTT